MEKVVEGFLRNGTLFLFEDIKMKFAKVKIIFQEETDEKVDEINDSLLKHRLKIQTRGFKFNREEIYDRQSLH